MNRHSLALFVYLAAVFGVTLVHRTALLALLLAGLFVFAGRRRWRLARRSLVAVALFNSIVTVSYVIVTLIRGGFSVEYVLLINVRVFLLTFLTFFMVDRMDFFKALAFSRTLTHLFSLALGHIITFRRLYDDFRMALESRMLERPGLRDLYRHRAATASFFLQKALHDTAEVTDAMKSRGFFND